MSSKKKVDKKTTKKTTPKKENKEKKEKEKKEDQTVAESQVEVNNQKTENVQRNIFDVPTEEWDGFTKPVLMKHERTRILATRVAQLQNRAPPAVTLEEMKKYQIEMNPLSIAKLELALRRTPMIIRRTLPGQGPNGGPKVIDIPIQELD